MSPFVEMEQQNFCTTGLSDQSGPLSEVVPNIPLGRNRNGPLHMTSDRNYQKVWEKGKLTPREMTKWVQRVGMNVEYGCL